jgi:hypothetical protein
MRGFSLEKSPFLRFKICTDSYRLIAALPTTVYCKGIFASLRKRANTKPQSINNNFGAVDFVRRDHQIHQKNCIRRLVGFTSPPMQNSNADVTLKCAVDGNAAVQRQGRFEGRVEVSVQESQARVGGQRRRGRRRKTTQRELVVKASVNRHCRRRRCHDCVIEQRWRHRQG